MRIGKTAVLGGGEKGKGGKGEKEGGGREGERGEGGYNCGQTRERGMKENGMGERQESLPY